MFILETDIVEVDQSEYPNIKFQFHRRTEMPADIYQLIADDEQELLDFIKDYCIGMDDYEGQVMTMNDDIEEFCDDCGRMVGYENDDRIHVAEREQSCFLIQGRED